MRICLILALLLLVSSVTASCSGAAPAGTTENTAQIPAAPVAMGSWPQELPVDGWQPWEDRTPSALTDAEYLAGAERFLEGGEVEADGETLQLSSGAAGEQAVSFSVYRLALGATEPGIVAADVNVKPRQGAAGEPSTYFIGLADYGGGAWEWHGPFADHHVLVSTAQQLEQGASYLSSLGHVFVTVLAYDGSRVEVVAVAAQADDPADTSAPPAPDGLTATARPGAVELGWQGVIAGDLAGYRIYWNTQHFFDELGTGVGQVDYLEGTTRFLLDPASAGGEFAAALSHGLPIFVRIAAVDASGNRGPLSGIVDALPLAGSVPQVGINLSTASALRDDLVTISVSGAQSYDVDTDGDGDFDLTGDTTGNAEIDTSHSGILRIGVRASAGSGDGTSVALGGVSLLVTGNSRPAVSATANPQSGPAPLDVTFTGAAEDEEDSAAALSIAWDFNGDGIFEADTDTLTPPAQEFPAPGLYNAKLRVEDSDGAWAVDTVGVLVTAPGANVPPSAELSADYYTQFLDLLDEAQTVFSATGSADPEGGALTYEFDPEGTGNWQASPGTVFNYTYTARGVFPARVRVTDPAGASDIAAVQVKVLGATQTRHETLFSTGWYPGLALVQGNPAIAHWDSVTAQLYYHRANDALGSDWPTSITVGPQFETYSFGTEMLVVAGNPAICYTPLSTDQLLFIRALDALGTSWPADPQVVDAGPQIYGGTMALLAGDPAIAYLDLQNQVIKFVRASDPIGGAWNLSISVDAGLFGAIPRLEVLGGYPCIAVFRASTNEVLFYRCNDTAGMDWPDPVVVGTFVGSSTSLDLAEVAGRPAILYTDYDNLGSLLESLYYTIAEDAEGTSWTQQQVLSALPGVFLRDCQLSVLSGRPAAFFNGGGLKVQMGDDELGLSWSSPRQLGLYVGQLNVVLDAAGNPLIAGWTNVVPSFFYYRPY